MPVQTRASWAAEERKLWLATEVEIPQDWSVQIRVCDLNENHNKNRGVIRMVEGLFEFGVTLKGSLEKNMPSILTKRFLNVLINPHFKSDCVYV